MSAAQMDPHDKMRSRDVGKVARGEQAPKPAHAPGTVSPPPENEPKYRAKREEGGGGEAAEKTKEKVAESNRTRPPDEQFPVTNQTRHCFNRYLQYHKCAEKKAGDANECKNFLNYIRSLCPGELVEKWDEQRRLGTLPASV